MSIFDLMQDTEPEEEKELPAVHSIVYFVYFKRVIRAIVVDDHPDGMGGRPWIKVSFENNKTAYLGQWYRTRKEAEEEINGMSNFNHG